MINKYKNIRKNIFWFIVMDHTFENASIHIYKYISLTLQIEKNPFNQSSFLKLLSARTMILYFNFSLITKFTVLQ